MTEDRNPNSRLVPMEYIERSVTVEDRKTTYLDELEYSALQEITRLYDSTPEQEYSDGRVGIENGRVVMLNLAFTSKLSTRPEVLDNLRYFEKLEYLNLNHCHVRRLPGCLGELIDLTYLHLDCNYLTSLPYMGKLTSLRTLDISLNYLTELPGGIENAPLTRLLLMGNPLSWREKRRAAKLFRKALVFGFK